MDILDVIRQRRSVRDFADKDIPAEVIEEMIEAVVAGGAVSNREARLRLRGGGAGVGLVSAQRVRLVLCLARPASPRGPRRRIRCWGKWSRRFCRFAEASKRASSTPR